MERHRGLTLRGLRAVDVQTEREFERRNIEAKRTRYLATNPVERYAFDSGWAEKVDLLDRELADVDGWILDIGGNTAGEATILAQRGKRIVALDINEVALSISKERAEKFGLVAPSFVAGDAHRLPFADGSFSAVTFVESLHHMQHCAVALAESARVVRPGGKLVALEPHGLDPIRRLSEVRDYFRGTIEKSFFRGQLRRSCCAAGLTEVSVRALSLDRSSWKREEVPRWRVLVYDLHRLVNRYGVPASLLASAKRPGESEPVRAELAEIIRSPVSGSRLTYDSVRHRWVDGERRVSFPDVDGIPVLLADEAAPED
jgi:ubiquinone/menaquinone biosynthesis C-methylase UbiE